MGTTKHPKVILITGCSSGFGYETAKELCVKGHHVHASMRDAAGRNKGKKEELVAFGNEHGNPVTIHECDVTSEASVNNAVKEIMDAEQHIDVLVNNAGYGIYGPIEHGEMDRIEAAIDTNVYGYIRTIKAVLPHMRSCRSGHVINVSSVLGRLGLPILGYYNAAKFAVEGLSEALLGECYLFDIHVSVVNPHMFATDFAGRSAHYAVDIEKSGEYENAFRALVDRQGNLVNPKSGPWEVARKIAWLVGKTNPPYRVPVGKNARRDMFFAKLLPPLSLQKIAAGMYGMGDVFKKVK